MNNFTKQDIKNGAIVILRNGENCPFYKVDCRKDNTSWVNNKDLYSEKFLNQEIEL